MMNGYNEDDYVLLLGETLESPAWRAMSHGAQALYVILKSYYSVRARNNGKIILSTRTAALELGSGLEEIRNWFRELKHFGFIVQQGERRPGYSLCWRLTELGYMKEKPTKDFLLWDGKPFVWPMRASRVSYHATENGRVQQQAGQQSA